MFLSATERNTSIMKIQMFMYPGMTLLDLVGPLQTWGSWPDAEFQLVAQRPGPVSTDSALSVNATHTFEQAWAKPDILFVPGGPAPTFELLGNQEALKFLAERGEHAGWITSVCTGSILLAAAGLLKGYRATSHWFARDFLAAFGAEVATDRWVIDRNRASGGGVTAGIDFGLAVMAHIAGEEVARCAQLAMEYSPNPPFASGTPKEALPETVKIVSTMFGASLGDHDINEIVAGAAAKLDA